MTALGVVALVVGVLLIVLEAHAPTAGVLGGVGALVAAAGVWILLSGETGRVMAIPVAAGVATVVFGVAVVAGRKAMIARRLPVRAGPQSMIGSDATVRSWAGSHGQVETAGGLWRARMEFGYGEDPALAAGESVVVEQIRGLTLIVRRREPWELSP